MTNVIRAVDGSRTHLIKARRRQRTRTGMVIDADASESPKLSAGNPYWDVHAMTASKSKLKELKPLKNSKHVLKLKMPNSNKASKDDQLNGMSFRMPGIVVPINLEQWVMRMIAGMQ